jgi:hypothetical protein
MVSDSVVLRRCSVQRLALPILLILISSAVSQIGAVNLTSYQVYVSDYASAEPVQGADVYVIRRTTRGRDSYWETLALCETDENGSCSFTVPGGTNYVLAILRDDPVTPGWDYIPMFDNIYAASEGETSLSLRRRWEVTGRVDEVHRVFDTPCQSGSPRMSSKPSECSSSVNSAKPRLARS